MILFIDDEVELLKFARTAFGDRYEVETAISTEEAELMMASRTYDVVICDHMLPGEFGLDFLIRTKHRFPNTKRFLITGYINPEFLSRSRGLAGLSGCILKPARTAELVHSIQNALDHTPDLSSS